MTTGQDEEPPRRPGRRAPPAIGPRTARWFALRVHEALLWAMSEAPQEPHTQALRQAIAHARAGHEPWLTHDDITLLVEWYQEAAPRYLWFSTAEAYTPRGPIGSWLIRWSLVVDDLPMACWPLDAAHDARVFPTLDDWIEAERNGRLRHRGVKAGGTACLATSLRLQLRANAERRRRRWPRACRTCGTDFTPPRGGIVRCDACRQPPRDAAPPRR